MRTSLAILLAYVLGVAGCALAAAKLAVLSAVILLPYLSQPSEPLQPTLVERREMEAAHAVTTADDPRSEPIRALSAPDVPAGVLAAKLDAAESADRRASLALRQGRESMRARPSCGRACRLALERRLENLE